MFLFEMESLKRLKNEILIKKLLKCDHNITEK